MRGPDPLTYGWWLASRAAGITAFALVSASVTLGLAMATKVLRGRVKPPVLAKLHEHLALAGLVAIAVHAITLLGDAWLHPGPAGVLVPFAIGYRPLFTGLGIIAAYLAALLGLSFYARRRIGAKRWRSLHRLTLVVYVLGVVHALGAGTDATTPWMRAIVVASGVPIVALALRRWLAPRPRPARATPATDRGRPRPAHSATGAQATEVST